MRDIRNRNGANHDTEHSKAAGDTQSKVVPMYPGWPLAELPLHERGLRQVGEPHPIARGWGYEN